MPAPTPSISVSRLVWCRASTSGRRTASDQAAAEKALARNTSFGSCRSRYPISDRTCAQATASIPPLCEDLVMAKAKPQAGDHIPELVESMLLELGEDPSRQGLRPRPAASRARCAS